MEGSGNVNVGCLDFLQPIEIAFHAIMATVHPLDIDSTSACHQGDLLDRHGWGFAAMLCVVGALFIRPTDVIPQFHDAPVYQFLIVTAMVLSYNAISEHLRQEQLASRPVTSSLMLLMVSVALSHMVHGFFWGARESVWIAFKLFALYLLMVSLIYSKERLEAFSRLLVIAITMMSALALADYMGLMELEAFTPIDDRYSATESLENPLSRIRGSGIFEDPNDLGLVLVIGIILSLYFLTKKDEGLSRFFWIGPGILLCATLSHTHSRGAFLALAAAVPAWIYYYRGWRFAVAGSVVFIPFIALMLAGRMTDLNSVYAGTGQTRIQIWSETFSVFRNSPIFGIGEGMIVDEIGVVSHNSFLQSYAELGLVGGTLFLGTFVTAIAGLIPTRDRGNGQVSPSQLHAAVFCCGDRLHHWYVKSVPTIRCSHLFDSRDGGSRPDDESKSFASWLAFWQ